MPIRRFLEGDVFEQALIEAMSKALVDACRVLDLKVKDDAATRLVAMRIIEAAREGLHDPGVLTATAIQGLRSASKH